MKPLFKNMITVIGVLFAVLILAFTGFQTWSLLYKVSGNAYIALLGLVLFEGGMLYWWFHFQNSAEGLMQMGLSLLGAIFGLLLIGSATALHLGAIDAMTFGESTPAKLITVAVLVNLVIKFVSPLVHPDQLRRIQQRMMEGIVLTKTYDQFKSKTDEIAGQLSDELASNWTNDLRTSMTNRYKSEPKMIVQRPDDDIFEPPETVPRPVTFVDVGDNNQLYDVFVGGRTVGAAMTYEQARKVYSDNLTHQRAFKDEFPNTAQPLSVEMRPTKGQED